MIKKLLNSIVDIILVIVGLASVFLSYQYSHQWLIYIGTPSITAIILAFILVVFAVSVFEFAAYTLKNNWKNVGGYALIIVWLLLAFYSMVGTLSSQYWQFQKVENARIIKNADSNNKKYVLNDLNTQIERLNKKYNSLDKIINSYDTAELRAMWRTTIKGYREDEAKVTKELDSFYKQKKELLISKIDKIILNKNDTQITVFEIYSKLFNWKPKNVQFVMQTFPAIFLDIISPLCFLFIMFDTSSKVKQKKEKSKIKSENLTIIPNATPSKGKVLITPDTIYGELPVKKKVKKEIPNLDVDVRNMYGDNIRSETRLTLAAAVKLYAAVRWYGIVNKKTKYLLGKDIVLKNTKITSEQYDRITKVALNNHLIKKSGVWSYPINNWTKNQFINAILAIFKEKT